MNLKKFLNIGVGQNDGVKAKNQKYTFNVYIFFLLLYLFVFSIINMFIPGKQDFALIDCAFFLVFFSLHCIYRKFGMFNKIKTIAAIIIIAMFLFLTFVGKPGNFAGFLWAYTFIGFSFFTFSLKYSIFLSLLMIVLNFSLMMFMRDIYSINLAIVNVATYIAVMIITGIFEQSRGQYIDIIEYMNKDLADKNDELAKISVTDPLTGLYNRRYLDISFYSNANNLAKEHFHIINGNQRRGKSEAKKIGIILVDMDHFKIVNDEYGHESGDMVLEQLSEIFQESFKRNSDICIRWGGEEFLIILSNTTEGFTLKFAKDLRQRVKDYPFQIAGNKTLKKTISLGVVMFPFFQEQPAALDFERSLTLCDHGLYFSKENGRDMVAFVKEGKNMPNHDQIVNTLLSDYKKAVSEKFIKIENLI